MSFIVGPRIDAHPDSDNKRQNRKPPPMTQLKIALLTSSCGLAGIWIGHRLNLRREKRQSIRDFRRKLGVFRSKVERQPGEWLAELYNGIVPQIQGDVSALGGDFCCGYRALKKRTDAFSSIPRSEINKKVGDGGLGIEFETGRKRILEAIDAINEAL